MNYDVDTFARTERLASLPEVSLRLIRLAQEPEPDFREAAELITGDPALCGRILKTVNSALFGLHTPVQTIGEALPKIGISMMRTLVLGFHLAESPTQDKKIADRLCELWRISASQAAIAEIIARKV